MHTVAHLMAPTTFSERHCGTPHWHRCTVEGRRSLDSPWHAGFGPPSKHIDRQHIPGAFLSINCKLVGRYWLDSGYVSSYQAVPYCCLPNSVTLANPHRGFVCLLCMCNACHLQRKITASKVWKLANAGLWQRGRPIRNISFSVFTRYTWFWFDWISRVLIWPHAEAHTEHGLQSAARETPVHAKAGGKPQSPWKPCVPDTRYSAFCLLLIKLLHFIKSSLSFYLLTLIN